MANELPPNFFTGISHDAFPTNLVHRVLQMALSQYTCWENWRKVMSDFFQVTMCTLRASFLSADVKASSFWRFEMEARIVIKAHYDQGSPSVREVRNIQSHHLLHENTNFSLIILCCDSNVWKLPRVLFRLSHRENGTGEKFESGRQREHLSRGDNQEEGKM